MVFFGKNDQAGEEPELNHAATGFFQDVLNQIG